MINHQISHKAFASVLLLLVACNGPTRKESAAPQSEPKNFFAVEQSPKEREKYEAHGKRFVIATQGQAATQAAKKAFDQGGDIIDAAVAASFAISVERPQSTGLGGGGFMLYREAKSGKVYAIDFRERAPIKAKEKMFLDEKGNVIPNKSEDGIFAVATPGLVAGLLEIHQRFGKLKRSDVMTPAIELADKGFLVYPHLADALKSRKPILESFPASKKIFIKENGEVYKEGEVLVQRDLAKTLRLIAQEGRSAFYKGAIAQAIVKESKAQHGLLTLKDFAAYKVKWRQPVKGSYKGLEIISMPPPSSGGSHVIEILNILEKDSLKDFGYGSSEAVHLAASAMQQAFADRATYMGDPDFNKKIPLNGLLSKSYASRVRSHIEMDKAKKSDQVMAAPLPELMESTDTTNFSIMDSEGNVVVSTQTINGLMGSGLVVPGTGIVMNNEMDDFSAKVGASNIFGAIGGTPNSIKPLKTPLSSMSPTIVMKNQQPLLALGAPGGTRIITCVAQTLLNYLEFKLPLYEAVSYRRYHHQWKPDRLDLEKPGFGKKVQKDLQAKGYELSVSAVPCKVNAVAREGEDLHGVADPRDLGMALAQ